MRSEHNRDNDTSSGPGQHRPPEEGGAEGQYEKESGRRDQRQDRPPRERELPGRRAAGGAAEHRERRLENEEPYRPSGGYEPFEPGHPREERGPFGPGPQPRYFGTGFMGRGGPGFAGGYYGFGQGSLEPDWRAGRRDPLGGEGAGAEPRAERRYPPGPKGYQRSDERLREDISERLMQAHYIDSSDVTVTVSGAKVVLEGTVPDRRMKHAIEDLADACPGVQDIENRIRVVR